MKKNKISICINNKGIEYLRIHKGMFSKNINPSDLDFYPYSWEEVKSLYNTNLHGEFIRLVLKAIQ